MLGRDIHGDRKLVRPVARDAAGFAQHPFADRQDQAGLFRQRDEFTRAYHTLRRVRPADQGLEALQPVCTQVVKRLEVQFEPAIADREPQIEFHLAASARLLVERGFEEVMVGLAVALGTIQRKIGVLHQGNAVLTVAGCNGNADAGRTHRLMPTEIDGAFEAGLDFVGQGGEIAVRFDVADQHGEFVSAEPRDAGLRQLLAKVGGGFAQQRVTGGMAHRVVDDLEIVEIDIGDEHAIVVFAQGQRLVQLLDEELAIGQPGQPVMQADMDDLALALGDRLDHSVEIGRQSPDLVLAFDGERRVFAASEFSHRDVEAVQRPCYATGDAKAERDDERQTGSDHPGEQIPQRGVLGERFAQRMFEHQARFDSVLQRGKARDVIEMIVLAPPFEDFPVLRATGPFRKIRPGGDARPHIDPSQFGQSIHFPRIERLRDH